MEAAASGRVCWLLLDEALQRDDPTADTPHEPPGADGEG